MAGSKIGAVDESVHPRGNLVPKALPQKTGEAIPGLEPLDEGMLSGRALLPDKISPIEKSTARQGRERERERGREREREIWAGRSGET